MVLATLVSMGVSPDKTVNSYLTSSTGEGSFKGKDVFYRLKNSPFICWRMLMWHLVHRFLKVTSQDRDVDDSSSRYLIFDDTTLSKTGKRIKDAYTAKRDKWKVSSTTDTKLPFKSRNHDHGTVLYLRPDTGIWVKI